MDIDVFDSLESFDTLRENWEEIWKLDASAHIFVAWCWLRTYFYATGSDFLVLAARPSGARKYVAFLPIARNSHLNHSFDVMRLGATPIADHTGFVCDPEYENEVFQTFAHYIQTKLAWERFHFRDVLDPRLSKLLGWFSDDKYEIITQEPDTCPYIVLPDTWEKYLRTYLSKPSRSKLRRRIKRIWNLDGFRVTALSDENAEIQIQAMLLLWQKKWGEMQFDYGKLLRHQAACGCLWLDIFWDETTPVAGMCAYVDREKKSFSVLMNSYNEDYCNFAPGRVMVAYSIQFAIEHGFRIYDFLRGDEPYKFSFGAVPRVNENVLLQRRSIKNTLANTFLQVRTRKRLESFGQIW